MDSAIKEMVDLFKGKELNFNVVIRQIANKNITEGNIDISMVADKSEKYRKGIVISIGTECPKGDINIGDTVIYDSYKASLVTLDTVEYVILYYADLIHVL